jgi:hypothetical protein
MGLAAVGNHKVLGPLTAGHLFFASDKVGEMWRRMKRPWGGENAEPEKVEAFTILQG